MTKQKFNVSGMTCAACSAAVERCVTKINGVNKVEVNLLTNSMNVEFDDTKTSSQQIIAAVVGEGFGATVQGTSEKPSQNSEDTETDQLKKRVIISAVFLVLLMYVSMGHMIGIVPHFLHGTQNAMTFAFLQFILTLPIIYFNRKYFINGIKSLIKRSPNMDTLIAVGSLAALIYGIAAIFAIGYGLGHNDTALVDKYAADLYFEAAAMILTLITLGKYFESKSKRRTSQALKKLMEIAPKTATVIRNGEEVTIPVEQTVVGDIVVVKQGNRIAVDGTIIEGRLSVDQAAITGESMPVDKTVGDSCLAATIVTAGYAKLQAVKVGENTTLSEIIKLVEQAGASKAPIARLADKVSGIFVPIVMIIAVIAFGAWLIAGSGFSFALSMGISVLVISCPCALGLATPVAIMVGTGLGANSGILFKNAESLELLHKANAFVLDKTGTITQGKPQVTDIVSNDTTQMLKIAAAIETMSSHPLAKALVQKATDEKIELSVATEYQTYEGRGVSGIVDGQTYFIGNAALMNQNQLDYSVYSVQAQQLAEQGKTVLHIGGEKYLGFIAVADALKPTAKQAIETLKKAAPKIIMLTGDNQKTAKAIAQSLDIEYVAEVFPQDKAIQVQELKQEGYTVAMIGDGINDAPALISADIGIAIGAGADIAVEAADVVLIKSDLNDAAKAVKLSKSTLKAIKQNLFWAFFYNILGIPIAAGILFPFFQIKLNPMISAAAMSFSSVTVVLNALRLKYFNRRKPKMTTKVIHIQGMGCNHCKTKVEQHLNNIDSVTATVDLSKNVAEVKLSSSVDDSILKSAVEQAGFSVTKID